MKIHRLGGKNVTGFAVIFVANLTQILSQGHGILGNQGKQDWAEGEIRLMKLHESPLPTQRKAAELGYSLKLS